MSKLTVVLKKYRYEILIFVGLCMSLLLLLFKGELIQDRFYGALTFDTHFGVYSLTLVGSLIRLVFGAHPTRGNVVFFQLSAQVIAYLLTALYCGSTLRKSKTEHKTAIACLIILVAGLHVGFSVYTELFDLFDVYWVIGGVLALFLVENGYTRFAVPLLAVTSLWVHFGFLMTWMPLIYIMCIYFYIRRKSKLGIVQLFFMLFVTVAGAVWFFISSKQAEIPQTAIEQYIRNKTGVSNNEISIYVWQHFTDMSAETLYDMEPFYELVGHKYNLFTMALGYLYIVTKIVPLYQLAVYLVVLLPFLFFFEYLWKRAIKAAENRQEKAVFVLCMLTPLVNFVSMLTSSDSSRMSAQLIIVQLLLVVMFTRDNNKSVETALGETLTLVRKNYPVIICLAAVLAALVFRW